MKITKENLIKVIKEEIGLVRMLNEGRRQYGFDLTDFKSGGFQKVLRGLGIRQKKGEEGRSSGWEWKGRGILIVTGNDPITWEYFSSSTGRSPIKRKAEKNYASYIGLEGDSKQVEKAVELIHKYASYIKREYPKRRSYI